MEKFFFFFPAHSVLVMIIVLQFNLAHLTLRPNHEERCAVSAVMWHLLKFKERRNTAPSLPSEKVTLLETCMSYNFTTLFRASIIISIVIYLLDLFLLFLLFGCISTHSPALLCDAQGQHMLPLRHVKTAARSFHGHAVSQGSRTFWEESTIWPLILWGAASDAVSDRGEILMPCLPHRQNWHFCSHGLSAMDDCCMLTKNNTPQYIP